MSDSYNAELFQSVTNLSVDLYKNFIDLSRLLCELQFCDRGLFNKIIADGHIGRRTAYYLVRLDLLAWQVNDNERLRRIGWSKLSILIRYVKGVNFKELLHYAETHTARDLALVLAGKTAMPDARCMLLYMSPEEYAFVENVLLAFGATKRGKGLVGKEGALVAALKQAVASVK